VLSLEEFQQQKTRLLVADVGVLEKASTVENPKPYIEISECDIPFERDVDAIKVNQKVDYTDKFAEKWKTRKK
jgi:hypothetical protein